MDHSPPSDTSTTGKRRFILSGRSVVVLLAMGGASLISKSFEDNDRLAAALDRSPLDGVLDVGGVYGNGLVAGLGSLGLVAAGKLAGSERLASAGCDLTESLIVTWAVVWALKLAVDADRPGGGDYSFPSGHAATAFSMAPVLTGHFGWKAGAPAYGLAVATAMGRIEEHKHYLADVLFGAAIGYVVGSEVTSRGSLEVIRGHMVAREGGLGLIVRF